MITRAFKATALVAAILGSIGAAHATLLPVGSPPVAVDIADLPAQARLSQRRVAP